MTTTYSPSHASFQQDAAAAGHRGDVNGSHASRSSIRGSSSSSNNNTSWDQHYQRRSRTGERFDYPSSEDFDRAAEGRRNDVSSSAAALANAEAEDAANVGVASPPSRHRRRSPGPADPRRSGVTRGTTAVGAAGARPPQVDVIRYYPSELPRYNAIVHDDAIYGAGGQALGHAAAIAAATTTTAAVTGTSPGTAGGSLTPTRAGLDGHRRSLTSPLSPSPSRRRAETAVFMVPGDPYEAILGADPRLVVGRQLPRHSSPSSGPRPTGSVGVGGSRPPPLPDRLHDRERRYYDYVKENLIMFGDGYGRAGMAGDAPSVATGLSQEELLHRKRREETWRKRRDRRVQQRRPSNRVVHLPSGLFMPHASRQQQQNQQQMQQQQQQQQRGSSPVYVPPVDGIQTKDGDKGTNQIHRKTAGGDAAFQPSFSNSGRGMKDYTGPSAAVAAASSSMSTSRPQPEKDAPDRANTRSDGGGGGRHDEVRNGSVGRQSGDDEESANSESNHSKGAKGIRASMVRRQRGDGNGKATSAGRRWKIIPSISRSKTDPANEDLESAPPKNVSEKDNRSKADPPAGRESASSAPQSPRDPPPGPSSAGKELSKQDDFPANGRAHHSKPDVDAAFNVPLNRAATMAVAASNTVSENKLSLQGISGSRRWSQPLEDDFDRFMDEPDLLSSGTRRPVSFDPGREDILTAEEYLTVQRVGERTPTDSGVKRPTYAEFTPKSDYPRQLFVSASGHIRTKERSPTSVMEFHTVVTPLAGVRWSETLTQQEYVTPQSAKLDPSSDHRVRKDPLIDPPKSILRKRSSPPGARSESQQIEVRSYGENDDCPSDESPTKPVRTERGVRVSPGASHTDEFIARGPQGALAFIDEMGRTVSPIFGASGSQSTEQDLVVVSADKELTGVSKWSSDLDSSFEKNIPAEFQEVFFSENQISKRDDHSGQLSDSYVSFIEAVASVVIQTKVRQFLSSKRVLTLRQQTRMYDDHIADRIVEESNATSDLSYEARAPPLVRRSQALAKKARSAIRAKASPRQDVPLTFFALAAIQIQAAYRGWWVRDCLAVDSYCASMIQKTYRGYVSRCNFSEELYRIVLVQSACRRFLAMDFSVTRMYCIVRIQSVARGFLVRKRMRNTSQNIDCSNVFEIAATMIQAQWRSFACEMQFLRAYEDILVVQSVARGWITRRLIRSWLKAHKMSPSSRLRGPPQRTVVSPLRPQLNSRVDINQNETTPPKKPSKRNDISPAFVHHIEYMRKALGPGVAQGTNNEDLLETKLIQSMPQKDDGKRRLFQEQMGHVSLDTVAPEKNLRSSEVSNLATKEILEVPIPDALSSKLKTVERAESKDLQNKRSDPTPWVGRSEIEHRRKQKELEAKAKEEVEQRRRETQAAELAELELRRTRMALKAEARKKEDEASKQTSKDAAEVSPRLEIFPDDEEKKESDSITIPSQDVVAFPRQDFPRGSNQGRENTGAPGARSKLQNYLAMSRAENVDVVNDSSGDVVEQPAMGGVFARTETTEVPVGKRQEVKQPPSVNRHIKTSDDTSASFSRKGGIVAERMRQMLISIERGASADTGASVDAGVAKVEPRGKQELNISGSYPSDLPAASGESNHGGGNMPTSVAATALNEAPVASPDVQNSEPVVKRIAVTSTAYGEEMRSHRSEAEQKRIDDMQAIFQKAGLMSRVKKAS